MRVLFVTHVNNMGGANRAMLNLILELRKLGVNCEVLLPRTKVLPKINLQLELQKYQIPYIEEYFFWYRINCTNGFIRYCSNLLWYSKILYILRKERYDIIHANSSFTDLGVWIAFFKKIPHVWHLREYGNWGESHPAFGRLYDRLLTRMTKIGIAISNKQGEYYRSIFPDGRLYIVYDGIENRKVHRSGNHDDIFNFCMVGNLCEGKNQMMAIEAIALLKKKKLASRFHITFVGGGDDYKQQLLQRIGHLKIDDYITFTGEVSDVDGILDTMDCGLILTNNEAFGRVTVEYMLHSLPVIATNSGANPELIEDNVNGFIVGQDDVDELASKMESLITYEGLSHRLGKAGCEIALNRFSTYRNAKQIMSLYQLLS